MSRRTFLQQASAFSAASVLGISSQSRAEPPPEISRIRLVHLPTICLAPQYLAEELLRLEGFSQVAYVPASADIDPDVTVAAGQADLSMVAATAVVPALDEGRALVVLRAILKAADICARQPVRAARYMVTKGYEASYDIALEVVQDVAYNAWRPFNPEDTLRFHALRLHESA